MNTIYPESHLEITIIIDSRIYGYLFAPIILALRARGFRIYVYVPQRILKNVINDIGKDEYIEYLDLDLLRKKNRWRWILHRVAMDIFVRDDFSHQLYTKNHEITKALPPLRRIIVKSTRFIPKVPNKSINVFLKKIAGIGMRNPFQTNLILAGSLNSCAELLCAHDQNVITIMESWDHAVKHPNGYPSKMVFVWNDDLKSDWKRVHNDHYVYTFYPLKLRYARNIVAKWPKLKNKNARPFFVYSVSSTRRFSLKLVVELEYKLIKDMARAAALAGWDLFIKPRPNGENGEFSLIAKEFSNVRVGSVINESESISQAADYFLDDKYNHQRFLEIVGASFIVNAFTTFGLDAAAAGMPVLQIDIRDAKGYAESSLYYDNYHLKTYLLKSDNILRIKGDFISNFTSFLIAPTNLPEQYSFELSKWVFDNKNQIDAIDNLLFKINTLAINSKKMLNFK